MGDERRPGTPPSLVHRPPPHSAIQPRPLSESAFAYISRRCMVLYLNTFARCMDDQYSRKCTSTCSPVVGAHVRSWEMINNQRPPRGGTTYEKASLRGNGGSIVATKGYLHTAISPPRCCRTYAIAPRSVLIAPRSDIDFGRTYRWPLPTGTSETRAGRTRTHAS